MRLWVPVGLWGDAVWSHVTCECGRGCEGESCVPVRPRHWMQLCEGDSVTVCCWASARVGLSDSGECVSLSLG